MAEDNSTKKKEPTTESTERAPLIDSEYRDKQLSATEKAAEYIPTYDVHAVNTSEGATVTETSAGQSATFAEGQSFNKELSDLKLDRGEKAITDVKVEDLDGSFDFFAGHVKPDKVAENHALGNTTNKAALTRMVESTGDNFDGVISSLNTAMDLVATVYEYAASSGDDVLMTAQSPIVKAASNIQHTQGCVEALKQSQVALRNNNLQFRQIPDLMRQWYWEQVMYETYTKGGQRARHDDKVVYRFDVIEGAVNNGVTTQGEVIDFVNLRDYSFNLDAMKYYGDVYHQATKTFSEGFATEKSLVESIPSLEDVLSGKSTGYGAGAYSGDYFDAIKGLLDEELAAKNAAKSQGNSGTADEHTTASNGAGAGGYISGGGGVVGAPVTGGLAGAQGLAGGGTTATFDPVSAEDILGKLSPFIDDDSGKGGSDSLREFGYGKGGKSPNGQASYDPKGVGSTYTPPTYTPGSSFYPKEGSSFGPNGTPGYRGVGGNTNIPDWVYKSPQYTGPNYTSPNYKSPNYTNPNFTSPNYTSPKYTYNGAGGSYGSPSYTSPSFKYGSSDGAGGNMSPWKAPTYTPSTFTSSAGLGSYAPSSLGGYNPFTTGYAGSGYSPASFGSGGSGSYGGSGGSGVFGAPGLSGVSGSGARVPSGFANGVGASGVGSGAGNGATLRNASTAGTSESGAKRGLGAGTFGKAGSGSGAGNGGMRGGMPVMPMGAMGGPGGAGAGKLGGTTRDKNRIKNEDGDLYGADVRAVTPVISVGPVTFAPEKEIEDTEDNIPEFEYKLK